MTWVDMRCFLSRDRESKVALHCSWLMIGDCQKHLNDSDVPTEGVSRTGVYIIADCEVVGEDAGIENIEGGVVGT